MKKRDATTPSRREFIKEGSMAAAGVSLGLSGCRQEKGEPPYLELEHSGELARREEVLWSILESCRLCPRGCGVNRLEGQQGVCRSGSTFKVASWGPHFGEEPPLVGQRGSGTIFFSDCNLLCVYCQNWQINHRGDGAVTDHSRLAAIMLDIQDRGCHNLNLVTPTHLVPHIVKGLRLAIRQGLRLPIVYNTGGYDSLEVIRLMDGIVSIYLPDFKYQDSSVAARYSAGAPGYAERAGEAIAEMHRQVGRLHIEGGTADRGLLIRHLVLPDNLAGTDRFARWVADRLGPETWVNLMAQYRPMHLATGMPPLDRSITTQEWALARRWVQEAGLTNVMG